MKKEIRKVTQKDLPEWRKLLKEVFNNTTTIETMENRYQSIQNNGNIHILGCFIKDKLVGTVLVNILVMPSGKEATIWDLAVSSKYRKQGIASKLMQKAEEIIKEDKEIKHIWLFSGVQRTEAHKLYTKLGYDENRDKAFVKTIY